MEAKKWPFPQRKCLKKRKNFESPIARDRGPENPEKKARRNWLLSCQDQGWERDILVPSHSGGKISVSGRNRRNRKSNEKVKSGCLALCRKEKKKSTATECNRKIINGRSTKAGG